MVEVYAPSPINEIRPIQKTGLKPHNLSPESFQDRQFIPKLEGSFTATDQTGKSILYMADSKLSTGGIGKVIPVWDPTEGCFLASKTLHEQSITPDIYGAFLREAQLLTKLSHLHILQGKGLIQGKDLKSGKDNTYFLMEYTESLTVKEVLANQTLPLEDVEIIFTDLVDTLEYLEQEGIFHRDLKPQNIFYDTVKQKLKLGDFGLATGVFIESDDFIAGSPAYCAPEVLRNNEYSVQSEIYSMGTMLYEMLADGEPLFSGEKVDHIIQRIIQRDEYDKKMIALEDLLRKKGYQKTAAIISCIQRATNLVPADRYDTYRDLLVDVQQSLTILKDSRSNETNVPYVKKDYASESGTFILPKNDVYDTLAIRGLVRTEVDPTAITIVAFRPPNITSNTLVIY